MTAVSHPAASGDIGPGKAAVSSGQASAPWLGFMCAVWHEDAAHSLVAFHLRELQGNELLAFVADACLLHAGLLVHSVKAE